MPSSEAPDSITRINDHLVHSESMFGGFPAGHKRRKLIMPGMGQGFYLCYFLYYYVNLCGRYHTNFMDEETKVQMN